MAKTPEQKAAEIAEAKKRAKAALEETPKETEETEETSTKEETSAKEETPEETEETSAKEETPVVKFKPKKGEEHCYKLEVIRGPKFNSETGEKIESSFYKLTLTAPEFDIFKKQAPSLGLKFNILYQPK